MAEPPKGPELPDVEPEQLRAAVRKVLTQQRAQMPDRAVDAHKLMGRLPTTDLLRQTASEAIKEEADDAQAAECFQSLLELGYLVASADGLAGEERAALAALVEYATQSTVDLDMLQLHFSDLDATCAALGRRERLQRAASTFETFQAREEAMGFATLVAIADGTLDPTEVAVLIELGEHFSFSPDQVRTVIDHVVASIKRELAG